MNASIAIYSGSMVIYWSSIVIAFGLAACLCLMVVFAIPTVFCQPAESPNDMFTKRL